MSIEIKIVGGKVGTLKKIYGTCIWLMNPFFIRCISDVESSYSKLILKMYLEWEMVKMLNYVFVAKFNILIGLDSWTWLWTGLDWTGLSHVYFFNIFYLFILLSCLLHCSWCCFIQYSSYLSSDMIRW